MSRDYTKEYIGNIARSDGFILGILVAIDEWNKWDRSQSNDFAGHLIKIALDTKYGK